MIPAELALTKTFFDIFVGADVYEVPRLVVDVSRVLIDSDENEAPHIASAYTSALSALASDLPRWRVAAEIAVQLDLYEALGSIGRGLERLGDPHQAMAFASLLASPSVSPERRAAGRGLLQRVVSNADMQRLLAVRLGDPISDADDSAVLEAQMWPGRRSIREISRFAPIVYVASDEAPVSSYWRVIGGLAAAGARVRRFASNELPQALPGWANAYSPLVHWSGIAVGAWKMLVGDGPGAIVAAPEVVEPQLTLPRLLTQVNKGLPGQWKLRPARENRDVLDELSPLAPDALREGAFDELEMMYLGAAGRSVVQQLSKDVLVPKGEDRRRWTFDQLVTLRLVQGFKVHHRGRADARKVYERLHDIAIAAATSEVAFDANGKLYVDHGHGFRTIDTDQEALDVVLRVDTAFKPFQLGGGKVPDLLRPSPRTAVDPRVLGGTPVVRGRRLSARALHDVYKFHGQDAMRSAYPEVEPAELQDALTVGRAIESKKRVA